MDAVLGAFGNLLNVPNRASNVAKLEHVLALFVAGKVREAASRHTGDAGRPSGPFGWPVLRA